MGKIPKLLLAAILPVSIIILGVGIGMLQFYLLLSISAIIIGCVLFAYSAISLWRY